MPGSRNPAKDKEDKGSVETIQLRNSVWYSNSSSWTFCLNPLFTKGEKFIRQNLGTVRIWCISGDTQPHGVRKRNLLEQNKPQHQQTTCELCYVPLMWKPGKPLSGWKPQNQNECGRGHGVNGLRKREGVKKSQLWRLVWSSERWNPLVPCHNLPTGCQEKCCCLPSGISRWELTHEHKWSPVR